MCIRDRSTTAVAIVLTLWHVTSGLMLSRKIPVPLTEPSVVYVKRSWMSCPLYGRSENTAFTQPPLEPLMPLPRLFPFGLALVVMLPATGVHTVPPSVLTSTYP